MTADDIRTIAAGVYQSEIAETGLVVTFDDMCTYDHCSYVALLAELPRPGASVDDEWAYAGPMLEEDDL